MRMATAAGELVDSPREEPPTAKALSSTDRFSTISEDLPSPSEGSYTALFAAMGVVGGVGLLLSRYFLGASWRVAGAHALIAAYLPSYFDMSHFGYGRKSAFIQHLRFWKIVQWYFRARVVSLEALDPRKQYIFGVHPHGIGTFNHFLLTTNACRFLTDVYPGERRDLAATVLFCVPLLRDFVLSLGCVDAGAATANTVLRRGWSLLIHIGGEKEQIMTEQGRHIAVVENRKGFCRLALQYGADIVPCYVWGENDLFTTFDIFKGFQLWVAATYRIALPPFWGRPVLWFVPKRKPLTLVVGRPIQVNRVPTPSRAQVDELHARYMGALQSVFDATKGEYGGPAGQKAVLEFR